jgi:hypothetical protein
MNETHLGRVYGLDLSVAPSAAAGSALLWAGLAVAARRYARLSVPAAAGIGLAGVLLHWFSESLHQLGHAQAARTTGYPMRGVRYHTLLGTSLYPYTEPDLPAVIHVRRALGGAPVSIALGALATLATLRLRRQRTGPGFLAWQVCLENLLVFGFGSLLPLGFTDGSTLLEWLPRLQRG